MKDASLHSILDSYQKVDLEDIGDILGWDFSPRLRKSQLVEQLHTYLHAQPHVWMTHLMERDIRQLRELVHAGPDKVQYMDYADYPSILEVAGLVQVDDSDEHYHKVWISREVYEIVAPEVDKVMWRLEKSGQYEVERIGLGLLNLYGVLPTDIFVDRMLDWDLAEYDGDYVELTRLLNQSPMVKMYRNIDDLGDYLCSPCVENPEEILTLRQEFQQENFPTYTTAEAREAGSGAPYFTVGMKTPEGMRLEQMYRRLGYDGFDLVKAEHDTWVEAQYTVQQNDTIYLPLLRSPQSADLDDETWLTCCEIVADYANAIPKWVLCGDTAAHSGKCLSDTECWKNVERENPDGCGDYPRWSMPQPTVSAGYTGDILENYLPKGFAIPHVAPDDPCPCGSGLRYCRCHGKFFS